MDAADDQHDNGSPSSQNPWIAFIQSRLAHVLDVTLRDQRDCVADARHAIDEELAAMQLAISSLRARRNTLVPISSLPSEVLARVFWFFSDPDLQGDVPSRLKWVVVTHVCRQWRDSALQHPNLWNELNFILGYKWVHLMLSRASALPLSIERLHTNTNAKIRDLILSRLSDIRHLSLRGTTYDDLLSFLRSFQSPARILESLKLTGQISDLSRDRIELDYRDLLPRLLRIELVSVPIRWSSPILCGLTHLKVVFDRVTENFIWPEGDARLVSIYSQFFCALERMPALEVLILRNTIPIRPQHLSGNHIVTLSHLRTLSLDDITQRCFDIIKQLNIPPSCSLSLEGIAYLSAEAVTDARSVLSNHTQSIDGSYPLVLATRIGEGHRGPFVTGYAMQFRVWRNCTSLVSEPENLSIRLHMPLLPDVSTMDVLFDALSLDDLRILSVKGMYGPSWIAPTPQRWIELFSRCRALEEMHLDHTVLPFIAALGLPVHSHSEQDVQEGLAGQQVFLKNLRSLILTGVDLDVRLTNETMTICESIVQALVARKQIKASLPTICVFSDCISSKSREELEKVAHVVQLSKDVELEVGQKYRRFL